MKNNLILIFLILSSISCKQGEEVKTEVTDPIYGKWYYEVIGSSSTKTRGAALNIDSSGKIEALTFSGVSDGSSAVVYLRKNIGTFKRDGDKVQANWSYETCNPIGSEIMYLKISSSDSGTLVVKTADQSMTMTMKRIVESGPTYMTQSLEDKNCNIVSKLQKDNKSRLPASSDGLKIFNNIQFP